MKEISIKVIVIILVIFWCATLIIPKSLVIPITASVGLVALLTGIIRIHEVMRLVRQVSNSVEIKSILMKRGLIAVIVACVSLALWVPLLTFRSWFILKEVNHGNVILWVINTGIYSYLLFIEKTTDLAKDKPIHHEDKDTLS